MEKIKDSAYIQKKVPINNGEIGLFQFGSCATRLAQKLQQENGKARRSKVHTPAPPLKRRRNTHKMAFPKHLRTAISIAAAADIREHQQITNKHPRAKHGQNTGKTQAKHGQNTGKTQAKHRQNTGKTRAKHGQNTAADVRPTSRATKRTHLWCICIYMIVYKHILAVLVRLRCVLLWLPRFSSASRIYNFSLTCSDYTVYSISELME